MKHIYNSTPPRQTDPEPWEDQWGGRHATEWGSRGFGPVKYRPRASGLKLRRYPTNQILVIFRKEGISRKAAIALHNSTPNWPGPAQHARRVLKKWIRVFDPP